MDAIKIPEQFICPISLQIMQDPVTIVSGITYDRKNIEQWLSSTPKPKCPVTKQDIPRDSILIPNTTLFRLIQSWCIANFSNEDDRIPNLKDPTTKSHVIKLLQDLRVNQLELKSLKTLSSLASESERNRRIIKEERVVNEMIYLIINRSKEGKIDIVEHTLNILYLIGFSECEITDPIAVNHDFIEALTWGLGSKCRTMKIQIIKILKLIAESSNSSFLERVQTIFFQRLIGTLRDRISVQITKSILFLLLESCSWGTNRMTLIEAGTIHELIELELETQDKKMTEMVLSILHHLCSIADGRWRFLQHAAAISLVSKRILRVSPLADDIGVRIITSICKYSGSNEVLQEMMISGGVAKLCMIIQSQCSRSVTEDAKRILKLHSKQWAGSPCIHTYILSRNA